MSGFIMDIFYFQIITSLLDFSCRIDIPMDMEISTLLESSPLRPWQLLWIESTKTLISYPTITSTLSGKRPGATKSYQSVKWPSLWNRKSMRSSVLPVRVPLRREWQQPSTRWSFHPWVFQIEERPEKCKFEYLEDRVAFKIGEGCWLYKIGRADGRHNHTIINPSDYPKWLPTRAHVRLKCIIPDFKFYLNFSYSFFGINHFLPSFTESLANNCQIYVFYMYGEMCLLTSFSLGDLLLFLLQYCTSSAVSNKQLYPTFARTIPADGSLGPSVVAILDYFNWNQVGLMSEEKQTWYTRGQFIESYLKQNGKKINIYEYTPTELSYKPDKDGAAITNKLEKIKTRSRGKYSFGALRHLSPYPHLCHDQSPATPASYH